MKRIFTLLHCSLCFFFFSLQVVCAQFVGLGPTGSATYTGNGGDGTGQIHIIAFPPGFTTVGNTNAYNVIYAGTPYGGLWKSTNAGNNWSVLSATEHLDLNSVNDIAISNETNYTIYISTGSESTHFQGMTTQYSCGIYKSTDYGATFQPITTFNSGQHFTLSDLKLTYKIAVSPFNVNIIFVGTSTGLFRSIDKGSTWQNVFMPSSTKQGETPGVWSIAFSPNDSNTVYCSADQVYKSTTKGSSGSFSAVANSLISTTGLTAINVNLKVASVSGSDKIYADVYTNYTGSLDIQMYAYASGSWSHITGTYWGESNVAPSADRLKFDVRPKGDTIIGGVTVTNVTINGGAGWTSATGYNSGSSGHADIHAVAFYPGGDSALIGTDGGIYKYSIHDSAVVEQNYGLAVSLVGALSTSRTQKGKFVIGKQDTNADWDDGQGWHQTSVTGDGQPPVLWDRVLDSLFYFAINSGSNHLYTFNVNSSSDFSNSPGCFPYSVIIQNPDPHKSYEIFGSTATAVTYSDQLPSANDFECIDTIPQSYYQSRSMYVPSGAPNLIYIWPWLFDPSYQSNAFYKFDRSKYTTNTSGICNKPAPHGTYTPDTLIKPLDAVAYTNTITCTPCYGSTAFISQCFPVGCVAASNTSLGKLWVGFDYQRDKAPTILASFPGQEIYRIRKSTDAGHTWTSDTAGLPQMPIEQMVYLDGSNDALFCATVNGRVFYKDAAMAKWTELDTTLPRTYIRAMEINYCQRKLYVGMFGRGVWVYDLSNGTPTLSSLQISGNVTWSSQTLDIGGNIDILSGGTLNIAASSLNMAKGVKITVEKGGVLYIHSGSALYNTCGEYWQGIEVMGDPTQRQVSLDSVPGITQASSFPQGVCNIDGSNLQNMALGICLGQFTTGNDGGSQLYANNTNFINNRYSVTANLYNNPNTIGGYTQCQVNNCNFNYYQNDTFYAHIVLVQNQGFQITGCTFSSDTNLAIANRGIGVEGIIATAEIIPSVGTSAQGNKFNYLTYGVQFFDPFYGVGTSTNCLKVSKCKFTGCQYGADLTAIPYATVMADTFNVPALYTLAQQLHGAPKSQKCPSYAIYLAGCNSYKVQDNTITCAASSNICTCVPSGPGPTYGIVVNNGSSENEKIRRNKITGAYYALVGLGRNSNQGQGTALTGLLWQCNDMYSSQQYDLWVTPNVQGGVTDSGSIQYYQGGYSGGCITPFSANRFNSSSPPTYNLIRDAKTYTYVYNYYTNGSGDTYVPANVSATYPITTSSCFTSVAYATACPDSIQPYDYQPSNALIIQQGILKLSAKLTSDQIFYSKILSTTDSGGYAEILDMLMEEPYISSSIIHQAILNPYANTAPDLLKNMLIRHAGHEDSIAFYLTKAVAPIFTKTDLAEIKILDNKVSSEEELKATISGYANQLEDMVRDEVDRRLSIGDVENALKALRDFESPNLLPLYADICVQSGRDIEAQTAIQKLSTYPTHHQNYHLSKVLPIVMEMKKAVNKQLVFKPYKQLLLNLYNYGDVASFKAATLLMAFGDTMLTPYLPIDTGIVIMPRPETTFWENIPFVNKSYLQVYPNPAANEVTLVGSITEGQSLSVEITDTKGTTVFKSMYEGNELKIKLETKSWQSGAYFIRLCSNQGSMKSAKIIINH